jgi:hypothetical protein
MPIIRSYSCPDCFHHMEVTLSSDQWDAEPPDCPHCAERAMRQEFKPVAIGGSSLSRAGAIAEEIARNDYGVTNMTHGNRVGDVAKVTYKDDTGQVRPAMMGAPAWRPWRRLCGSGARPGSSCRAGSSPATSLT